jgi:hypothetical protein
MVPTKLIGPGQRARLKSERHAALFGVELRDAREEIFVRMVCDGLALGVAFARAGFTSKAAEAPSNLFHLRRVQERANAILEARRTSGVVTLPEVTDMLKRVFAGAHSEGEYSAAHNAAFSLARLYGHVTDRATLEVIRRPSRDPDAPSEQALAAWVDTLPSLPSPGPVSPAMGLEGPGPGSAEGPPEGVLAPPEGVLSPPRGAPAAPLGGPGPQSFSFIKDLSQGPGPGALGGPGPREEFPNEINWLDGTPGQPENGAPSRPVTGTPTPRARSGLLGPTPRARSELLARGPGPTPTPTPIEQKGAPRKPTRVPGHTGEWPPLEDLF